MTKTARKTFARKSIVLLTIALLVVVLALQLVSAPVFSVAPRGNSSVGADSMNGVSISYREAEKGLISDSDSLLSDPNVAANASTAATPAKNEEVTVIVSLTGTPMMQYATANGISVAEALNTKEGKQNLEKLESIRKNAYDGVANYIIDYRYEYSTVMNAFSATVKYGDVEAIGKNKYVKNVILSNTYLAPQTVTENYVDVYETGIFNSSGIGYDGTGTVVAVVDTGTDYTHEVFDMELDPDTLAITKDDVAAVAPMLTATSLSAQQGELINEDDLYLKSKLPFAYDYADSDANVYPHESHGTHVAGIIAGKSDVITGVATGAQIATFKVFSDYNSGAKTEWILAGLNDAVTLGVDAINMSLGTSCGFSRESDEEGVNEIYDAINEAGICLVVAASNDASSAQNSTWGNTNLATNPDSGTIGSPGSYTASLSVGSVSGVKTKYVMVDGHEVYFAESRLVGKTESNDFVNELLKDKNEGEYDYVVVPGVGLSINYTNVDVNGKIAVIKRGSNSFEEKVKIAMDKGAVGVICYNNISGTISMSVGTKPLIPSCFITMDMAEPLVASGTGKLKVSKDYLAGPFMSDFSSWGVLPDLTLAPDITAHGGEIYSSVAGGDQYDRLSGTSMAAPNLAGALILVRQYVKESHPEYATTQTRDESYSRMMSTATIVKNEYGNPYSPRKQGAGIADIAHSINTKAYLTVDGSNKPKLSLGDDPSRTGVYTMTFNIVNTSNNALSYNLGAYVMTESMSSDERTVAERSYMLDDALTTFEINTTKGKAVLNGSTVSLSGYGEVAVTATVKLTDKDKAYLNDTFKNGMFVEGYINLESNNLDGIDMNIPYLAFYGNWADAPMLDVTAYEVGESAADDSVIAEDKLQADVYGTLPYAGFASAASSDGMGYTGMGAFAYITANGYTAPETQEKFAALTTNPDGDYLFYAVSAGLLRGAKRVDMEIRNSATGELIWSGVDYNARKSHSSGGGQTGGFVLIELDIRQLNLPNNAKYTFSMECFLDWKDQNDEYTYGNKNKFSFEFTVDNEAPQLTDVAVRKDTSGSATRYYLDLTLYDNHYVQCYAVYTYEGYDNDGDLDGVTSLAGGNGVIPVNGEFNRDTTVSLDISAYWSTIQANEGKLYLNMYDYAKNMTSMEIVIKQETDLQISKTRTARDEYTVVPNGQLDLAQYITVRANTLDGVDEEDKAYIEGYWTRDLVWESSDPNTVEVNSDGLITGLKTGTSVITVRTPNTDRFDEQDTLHCLKFTITVDGDPTTISISGVDMYVDKTDDGGNVTGEYRTDVVALERGESAVISAKIKPYNYVGAVELEWSSTSSNVRIDSVADDGMSVTVFAVRSGSATIRATVKGSRISGYMSVRVKNEFNMTDNIYLRSYTGRGGDYVNEKGEVEHNVVEIPDDLGIVYIYPQAFFNNKYIKKVIIPEGVTTIMQLAFYGCSSLEEVVLPSTVETIEEGAFFQPLNYTREPTEDDPLVFPDEYIFTGSLKKINLENVKTIGERAFLGCLIEEIDLSSCTYIDALAFAYCKELKSLDLSRVGTVGGGAFESCIGLETLDIPENTTLEYHTRSFGFAGAFMRCDGLTSIVIRSKNVGSFSFAYCESLRSVTFMNDVDVIGDLAFFGCEALTDVTFNGTVYEIGDRAFGICSALTNFKLPAGLTIMGEMVFVNCTELRSITVSSGALLETLNYRTFGYTSIGSFIVEDGNKYLASDSSGVLYDRAMKKVVAFPWFSSLTSYTVPSTVKTIGSGAFSGAFRLASVNLGNTVEYIEREAFSDTRALTQITGYNNVKYIGDYAFHMAAITSLPISANTEYIGDYAFGGCSGLDESARTFTASSKLKHIGDYAFTQVDYTDSQGNESTHTVPLTSVSFENCTPDYIGEGLFRNCTYLTSVDLGKLTRISDGMFMGCSSLRNVVIPNTVTSIGIRAFDGCAELSSVTLSNALTAIADGAFAETALTSVSLPDGVKSIGARAFVNTNLTSIDLKNVETIGNSAFSGTTITTVSSEKVTSVGNGAFAECPELLTVSLPNAQKVGASAFEKCAKLNSVTLTSAKTIGSRAFANCDVVTAIDIKNVEAIGDEAFSGAKLLATVTLEKVKTIGSRAFSGTAVTTIDLPVTLEKVADGAFFGAQKLTTINVADGNKSFINDDNGVLYSVNDKGYYTLVSYPSGKTDLKEYTVLYRTVKLGAYSFGANTTLEKITLPVYLQVIGISAMSGMTKLNEIVLNAVEAPTLESAASVVYRIDPDTNEIAEDRFGNQLYDFVNVYDNFNFPFSSADSDRDLTITVPANSSGYTSNKIWNAYVGKYIVVSNEIHAIIDALDFIERVKALPENPTAADASEISALLRVYNMFNAAQTAIVRGQYSSYSDGDLTINSEYYTELLGGVNYYNMLTTAQSKLPRSVASAIASATTGEQELAATTGYDMYSIALMSTVVVLACAVIVSAIINKRRSRK